MTLRARKASWFISGLVLVTVVSASLTLVMAQSRSETSRPASDTSEAVFEPLGARHLVNINTITYAIDGDEVFDIFFSCSSGKGLDPLRLTDPKDVMRAKSFFNDEKQYGKRFIRIKKYCINVRNIAYIETRGDALIVNFNARVVNSFVSLTAVGTDAEAFRRKLRAL